jgi:hypothetical protein
MARSAAPVSCQAAGKVPQLKQVRNRPELALDRCSGGRTLRGGSGALGGRAAER